MAGVRWALRSPQQRRLEAIRTLFYFVPAIEEALTTPPEPGYIQYLAAKLRPFVIEKEAQLASPPIADPLATLQNPRWSRSRDS